LAAPLARAHLVDPGVLHDAKHPTVQACAGLPLFNARQRPFERDLHQVIGVLAVASERAPEPPQARQQSGQLFSHVM